MNLNEAAEIANKSDRTWLKQNLPPNELRAYVKLVETMLSELDPTPISEKWLRENGWEQKRGFPRWFCFKKHSLIMCANGYALDGIRTIQTIGELRTMLRLCGAPKKENDA